MHVQSKLRGPGAYSIETGTFTVRAMEEKLKGPNWERAQDVAKMAAMPHVLYKNQWEHKKELVTHCALLGMILYYLTSLL